MWKFIKHDSFESLDILNYTPVHFTQQMHFALL